MYTVAAILTASQMRQTGSAQTEEYVKAFNRMLEALIISQPHLAYLQGHKKAGA